MNSFFTPTPQSDPNEPRGLSCSGTLFRKSIFLSLAMAVLVLFPNLSKAQASLTIGTGTSTTAYFPIYTYYGYNYSQSTYLASELVAAGATAGTPGYISSISYDLSTYYSDWSTYCKDWVIYMGNTSKSTFASTTDWIALSALTKVFDGTVLPTGTGWVKITFATPFYWDGSSNLAVAVDENTPDYSSTMPWYYTSRTGTRSISFYADGTNPSPATPPTSGSSFVTLAGTPNIKIDYTPATPCSGTTVGGSTVASATTLCPGTSASISVTGATVGTGLTWQWESAPLATGPWTDITGATATNVTVTPASGTTTYYRRKTTCTSTGSAAYSTNVAVSVGTALSVPYTETFESVTAGNNVPCATASPSFSPSTYYYGYDYWKIINDASSMYAASNHTPGGQNYLVASIYIGNYPGYGVAADFWFTPGISLSSGKTYRFSYWHRMSDYAASSYSGGIDHGMYYSNEAKRTASGLTAIKPDILACTNNTYVQNVGDFSVPTTGIYYMGIKANNTSFGGYYCAGSFDDINLVELPPCNTAASLGKGGNASASPYVVCSTPGTTNLSVTGTPAYSGLTFSWEVASGTPTSFASAGISTASGSYSIATGGNYFFRCKITCPATGVFAYSDTVKVTTAPITPPYVEDFEKATPGTNLPCAGTTYWGSIPTYWNISGSLYSTAAPGITNHTPGGSKFLHAGYYLGYGTGKAEYWFTPGLALTAAKAYNVSYWYSNSGYYPASYATYETDMGVYAGTSQTAAGMTISTGGDTTIYINAIGTATYDKFTRGFIAPTTGTYYVGLKVNHKNYCYYGFAIDDIGINQLPPCSAKPAAGMATASPSLICSSGTSTVSLKGISLASDLSFQWQVSTTATAGSWTNIAGANLPAYTTPTLSTSPWYYRCVVVCGAIAAPNSDTSAPAKVSVGALDLPYVEDFETGSAGVNMPCASNSGTWNATSLQYWSLRSGAYSTSYPGVRNHTPGGKNYIYSGYYNGPYYATGDQFYWFTPALKMTAGKGYKVGFWYNGAGYSTSYNGLKIGIYAGTAQTAAGMTIRAGGLDSPVNAASNTYAQMTRSFVAPTTGNYYVGIKTSHTGYNYPGIPIDDINIEQMPDCSGKPVAGVPDAYPYLICASGTTTFRLSGTTVSSGIQYQWQQSTVGATGPWSNAIGGTGAATGDYLTPSITATRWYRCVVTCSASGLRDTSAVGVINVGAITPPYTEDFERAIVGVNVPCAAVVGTWTTASTYSYWTIKGAPLSTTSYPAVRNITPGGSQYLYCGNYPGYSISTPYYWFTPAIKFTAGSSYEFSYWYSGSGYSGGSTTLGMYYGTAQTAAAMTTAIRPDMTGINTGSPRQILGRFVAPSTGNFYVGIKVSHPTYTYPGIALDDIGLNQLPPCTGAPTAGAISSSVSMLCTPGTVVLDMDLAGVTKAAGLNYRWYASTTGPAAGFAPLSATLAGPAYTTPTVSATSWFYCVVKCSLTGDSVISAPVKVDVGAVIPPYIETFETVTPGVNAPCASYTGAWGAGMYWYTYGSPFSSSYPSMDNHTAGGSRYLYYGYYFWYSYGPSQYWFSPAIQLKGGSLYQFSFWYNGSGYAGGKSNITPYIGTAQTAAAMTTALGTGIMDVVNTSYKYYKHSFTPASSGNYYLGLNITHTTYNYPGIVIDDIGLQEVPPCSAPVAAGTIVANPRHVCSSGGTTVLDLEGSTLATGLTYEWLASSSPAGPFTATGGTGLPYNTDPLISSTWFRAVVTCSATGIKDTSAVYKVNVGGLSMPYTEDFESTSVNEKPTCSESTDVWGNSMFWNLMGSPYGSAMNNTPGGKKYLIAGYYLGYATYSYYGYTNTDDNYWFTPGLAFDSRYKYDFSFWYVTGGTSNKLGVFYGNNQSAGAMVNTLMPLTVITNSSYEQFTKRFKPALSGTYYLGFKKTAGGIYSYPGVGIDDINMNYAPCDGMPFAGNIRSSIVSGTPLCVNTYMELADTGATTNLVPGIKYQWVRRAVSSGAAWSAVKGATDSVLKADTLIGYEYKFGVICGNTGDTAFSAAFQLPALPAHPAVVVSPSSSPVSYCMGDTVKFNATLYTGGVYDWMVDSVVQYGWKFSDMGATEPGEYMVRVTSPLSPCPAYSNRVKLQVNDPGYTVEITKPADSIICDGDAVLLTAIASKGGVSIKWRKDNADIPFATGGSYLASMSGYYRAVAADGISLCPAVTRNVHIIVKPNPDARIAVPGGTLTACENEGVVLKANPGYSYEWMRGGSPMSGSVDDSLMVHNSGSYSVKVRTADGCMDVSTAVTVNILPSPAPVITKTILGSGSVELSTTTFLSYQWYRNGVKISGAVFQKLGLFMNGIYTVVVTGTNSCEGTSDPIEISEEGLSIGNPGVQTDQIRIYPNPTQSKVFIESPVAVQVSVKDITGKTVLQSQEVKEVDLSKYADGIYLFTISDKEGNELIRQQRVTKFTK
jgi:hypothetical protein